MPSKGARRLDWIADNAAYVNMEPGGHKFDQNRGADQYWSGNQGEGKQDKIIINVSSHPSCRHFPSSWCHPPHHLNQTERHTQVIGSVLLRDILTKKIMKLSGVAQIASHPLHSIWTIIFLFLLQNVIFVFILTSILGNARKLHDFYCRGAPLSLVDCAVVVPVQCSGSPRKLGGLRIASKWISLSRTLQTLLAKYHFS